MQGSDLRIFRKNKGWTQKDFAKWLGLKSERSVVGWERGENPVPNWVERRMVDSERQLNPSFSLEDFLKIQAAAQAEEKTVDQWIADTIKEAVSEYTVQHPTSSNKAEGGK